MDVRQVLALKGQDLAAVRLVHVPGHVIVAAIVAIGRRVWVVNGFRHGKGYFKACYSGCEGQATWPWLFLGPYGRRAGFIVKVRYPCLSVAKKGRAYPHDGRALAYGHLEVIAHAHAEAFEAGAMSVAELP